jgi:hypothetical protein
MGFARHTAQFGECHGIRQETHNQKPPIASDCQQDAPAEHHTDQQVSQDGKQQFHATTLRRIGLSASRSAVSSESREGLLTVALRHISLGGK